MQISKTNSLAFKSTIKVISPECFDMVCFEMKAAGNYENICNWDIIPEILNKSDANLLSNWQGFRTNMSKGFTRGVRSCISGVAARNIGKAPLFWHIENNRNNNDNLHWIKDYFKKASNCILIGSKSKYDYSSLIFNKIKKMILDSEKPVTIMQDLENDWEAHLAYFSKEDELYLAVNKIHGEQDDYVKTLEDLKQVFKFFVLSKKDKLEFLHKEKFLKEFGVNKASKALRILK